MKTLGHESQFSSADISLQTRVSMFNLKYVYIFVFTSLAGWALFAYITTTQIINSQHKYAHIINVAGKQRMLSQKIALIANRYYDIRSKENKEHLISILELMKSDHAHIVASYIQSKATASIYFDKPGMLGTKLNKYHDLVAEFVHNENFSLLRDIESLSFTLLPMLDNAVNAFEKESELETNRLLERELFILLGTLITLFLESVFIVLPAIKYADLHEGELNKLIKQRTLELEKLSVTDQLTKLYNRRRTDETLSDEIERAKRSGKPFSVILVDIDKFKIVNDTYGHLVGDDILLELANILSSNVRKIDTLGRWGGEEFLIIDTESDRAKVVVFAEKIRKSIEAHTFEKVGQVTCSFGVTHFIENDTASTILSRADKALYIAKDSGRNCVKELLA